MKCYCQRDPSAQKHELTHSDGPFHRFYRPNLGRKTLSILETRLSMATALRAEGQEERLRQLFQHHRHKFQDSHRENGKTPHLHTQGEPFSTLPSSHHAPIGSSVRVAWIQQNLQQLPKALSLRTRFSDAGMSVNTHQWKFDDVGPLECELILFDCCTMIEQEMMRFLLKIRFFSQAPLIVLTDNHTLDWSVTALRGGADAIFTVNMPDDVILARSNALLRRWIPS